MKNKKIIIAVILTILMVPMISIISFDNSNQETLGTYNQKLDKVDQINFLRRTGVIKSNIFYEPILSSKIKIMKNYVCKGDYISKNDKLIKLDKDFTITSPINGYITELSVADNDIVEAFSPLMKVVNNENLYIEVAIDPSYEKLIYEGMIVKIHSSQYINRDLSGTVFSTFMSNNGYILEIKFLQHKNLIPGTLIDISIPLNKFESEKEYIIGMNNCDEKYIKAN